MRKETAQHKAPGEAKAAPERIAVRKEVRKALGEVRAFAKRIAVKMLADGLVSFTIVFVVCAAAMLTWELVPWITREGVTDIDPLPIIVFSFAIAFAAASLRYNLMKKFSGIRP